MEMSVLKLREETGKMAACPFGYWTEHDLAGYGQVLMERGFYFWLVVNGTTGVADAYHCYDLSAGQLLVVTPSVTATLGSMSTDFAFCCLYIEPDYYDGLSVGQLVYSQVSQFIGNYRLPVFSLNAGQADGLRQAMGLFAGGVYEMQLYRDGAIRHLCSFVLLRMADALYQRNREEACCVKRSSEIFRNFKRLLVHHYREQHNIRFYADRLNISTTYLSRIVKEITGHTVCFHVSELLCADARKLLECTDRDVKEIADELGFSDQSVFGKFFVRKTGLSPMKFRMRPEEQPEK